MEKEATLWKKIGQTLVRVIRAPFLILGILIALLITVFVLATVSVGDWSEKLLRLVGYRARPYWLPGALGLLGYVGLGIAAPAYLGALLIGWPGGVAAPVIILACIAVVGRW